MINRIKNVFLNVIAFVIICAGFALAMLVIWIGVKAVMETKFIVNAHKSIETFKEDQEIVEFQVMHDYEFTEDEIVICVKSEHGYDENFGGETIYYTLYVNGHAKNYACISRDYWKSQMMRANSHKNS